MSIVAGFMVPHPPMIVKEVGRGSEDQVRKTIESYENVADEIAAIAPDTIIITSPHSVMYSDYFHISPGKSAKGSFMSFGAPEVKFNEAYDSELVDVIDELAVRESLNAGTMGERDSSIDHGTMVPLYFIRQKYKGGKIVRIGLSGLPFSDHYKLGQLIKEAVGKLGRKAVFVGSGDLSHKLQTYEPYGFAEEGPVYDRRIMDVCGRGAFGELFDFDEHFCEKAAECGHRSFIIMAGAFDGEKVKATEYSHEDVTGVGYGICSFYPTGEEDSDRKFLDIYLDKSLKELEEKRSKSDPYVNLARKTIEEYITNGNIIDVPDNLPKEMINKTAGAFVSIHKQGNLRGCIGTILATRENIAKEIIGNAISASTKDPRFNPIKLDELKWLDINVDILGEPEDIDSEDKLDVKKYGVIVTKGLKRGLLLPDLEGVDTVKDQIAIAKRKAGIPEYDDEVSLQRFEVIRHY